MTEEEKEKIPYILFPVISFFLFIFCIVFANLILPEYCSLFSNNIESPFACDAINLANPQPCAYCRDKGIALAASIVAGFGIVCFFTPFLVFLIETKRSHPIKQIKLFD